MRTTAAAAWAICQQRNNDDSIVCQLRKVIERPYVGHELKLLRLDGQGIVL